MYKIVFTLRLLCLTLVVCLCTMGAVAQKADETSMVDGSKAYDELLSKVIRGDLTIDFKAFRHASVGRPNNATGAADAKAYIAMVKALNDKNFKEAVRIASEIQKTNFVDMNSHVVASMAYQGLGDAKKSKFHEGVYLGLINSILNGGDGNSTKTAYIVISIAEEFALLDALDLKRTSHSAITEDGRKYDVLTVTDKKTNETSKVYFNTDLVVKVKD
ncbi:hypothetical protein BH20ACI2_BH20ACI2_00980 [soil metagenome]